MLNLLRSLKDVLRDTRGQGMVEYALILALIAVVVAVALGPLGTTISNLFASITSNL